jgi:hypothetical protein
MSRRARSKWGSAKGRASRYSGPFVGKTREMLESPAFMVLSGAARRVQSRLEIELLHHGGNDNGKLVVTFDQFENYLIGRKSVAPALRELEALGFIEIVERGCAGNAGYGKPNIFRLTYRPSVGAPEDGSHEWRRVKTIEDALRIQKAARATPPQNSVRRGGNRVRKNKTPVGVSPLGSGAKTPLKPGAKTPLRTTKSLGAKTPLLSRSRPGRAENVDAAADAALRALINLLFEEKVVALNQNAGRIALEERSVEPDEHLH